MASSTSARPDEKRHVFMRDGQVLYEWDQSLDEINLYIRFSSEQVRSASKDLVVRMKPTHLTISLKAESTPMIDELLHGTIVTEESTWTYSDGELTITLQKMAEGETWPCVFKGHNQLAPEEQEEERKNIMLERFQKEHPEFDFSNADFSGQVPDARTFMGGMSGS